MGSRDTALVGIGVNYGTRSFIGKLMENRLNSAVTLLGDCRVGHAIPTKTFGSGVIFHGTGARCGHNSLRVTGIHLTSG